MATALETALRNAAAGITDPIPKAAVDELITEYVVAKAALATQAGNSVISYSIAGRSVTRQPVSNVRSYVRQLESDIAQYLYGSVNLVDISSLDGDS